jgi:glycosyltransferase involved in cell wall biosynthesis
LKVYLTKINESWIVDKIRSEFYLSNPELTTDKLKDADIVWVIAPWLANKLKTKKFKNKKVLCSVYHLDETESSMEDIKNFKKFDQYVDLYHTISLKSKFQIEKYTNKPVIQIPLWVNSNDFYPIENKKELREKYELDNNDYLVGSFQRDSLGSDLTKPKLIKGPDIFLDIVKNISYQNENLKVILAGKRRDYVIKNLLDLEIDFKYFEMAPTETLNELYNILDIYIVSSRVEGGPQAIVESAITKTPIVSTDVGVASQVLSSKSLFDSSNPDSFFSAKPDIQFANKKVKKYETPQGFKEFISLLSDLYES